MTERGQIAGSSRGAEAAPAEGAVLGRESDGGRVGESTRSPHERFNISGLGQMLPFLADTFGDKTALITSTRSLSFAELDDLSDRLASSLRRLGVGAGSVVALFSPNRWEWIVSYHATLKLGAVVSPLNVMLTPEEALFVLRDAEVSALIGSNERLESVSRVLDSVPTLDVVVDFDLVSQDSERHGFAELTAAPAPGFVSADVDPSGLACIAYTSGTTGHPKGAMQSQRSLVLNCAYTATMHARSSADTVVTALPCTHVYGNVAINGTFLVGGTVVLLERFDAARVLELIGMHRATLFEGVPTMYALMLNSPTIESADLGSLTRSTVGGQTIAESIIDRWEALSGAPLLELWGMTELSGLGSTHALYAPNVHGSIGVALPGTELKVAAIEDPSVEVGPGVPGELMARGPLVTTGYHHNESATAELLESDGWLHTGDVATHDGLGHFFVVDRLKDMILTGGYNVYPAEIERVLIGHQSVALVAVGREPDETKGEVAHAYVVLVQSREATAAELIDYCRQFLAAYKVPRAVHFVESLPTTSSGKLMRRKLRAPKGVFED